MAVVSILTFHLTMTGENIDSLNQVYINADKSAKIEIVNRFSQELYDKGITDSLYHVTKSGGSEKAEAMMHYLIAEYYYDQELYEAARDHGLKANDYARKRKADKFRSDVLGVLSSAQFRLGDYNGALNSLLEAYQVDKSLDDKELISSDLNSLAAIYLAVGQPLPGIKFIEKAIAIERELGRNDRLATRLGIASELYLLADMPDKAMEAIDEAYQIEEQSGKTEKVAVRMIQKGAVLEHMSELDEARAVLMKAMPVLVAADNTYSMAVGYNQLGSIEQKQGHPESAAAYYKKALEQSIKCGSPKVERIAERGLWQTLRQSDPNVALIHLERYTVLTDSLHDKMKSVQAQVMETTAINFEKTELNRKSALVNDLLFWGGLALVVMLAAMLAGLFLSWRRGKKTLHMQRQTQEMRSHFFTNITNELQTPLTVVMGAGQQLIEGRKASTEENKRLGSMIVNHGKNMLELINRLLDIEKVKSAVESPELKPYDIVLFVKLLVDNYAKPAQQKLIHIDFSSPVTSLYVFFAHEYIRKIVHGLIGNAIKFTPRNGSVLVTLTPYENDRIRLVVSDTGKGIPGDELDRIFEPFSQSDHGDEGLETALDLSLVNQLVLALNGTITVDSGQDQGTTFTIEFPVQPAKNEADFNELTSPYFLQDTMQPTHVKRHKPLTFIVENNEYLAMIAANKLRDDFDLRFAVDGREALQNATEMVPDLIITNIMMPVMDGKELMKQLRSTPTLAHIPIIALTSDPSTQERMSCIEAGADAVLVKPFYLAELRLAANHLISQRRAMRDRIVKVNDGTPEAPTESMSKEDKAFINRLVDVIHAQMSKEDINIDHIAAAMSLSRKQLRARVMSLTGLTPVAYILQVRLNYARHLIASEDLSLTAIASKCGFQNLSHFSKAFKQQFGTSPMQYRKSNDQFSHLT